MDRQRSRLAVVAAWSMLAANGPAAADVIVSGTTPVFERFISVFSGPAGLFPVMDQFIELTAGPAAVGSTTTGDVLVGLSASYTINLTTGAGIIETRTVDGSFRFVVEGAPGTFFVTTYTHLPPPPDGPSHAVVGKDVPVTLLETPIGTAAPIAPGFPELFERFALGFGVDPLLDQTVAAGSEWYTYRGRPHLHYTVPPIRIPEPSALVLLGVALLGLAVLSRQATRRG